MEHSAARASAKKPNSSPLPFHSGAFSAATVVGIAGGLIDFGVPDTEARLYEGRIKDGRSLISVHTENPDKCDRAREIFSAAGAEDICTMMNVSTPNLPLRSGYGNPRTSIA
ncbi:MAG TPA: hypothetical protein VGA56_14565 [Opitutaceae bacterium]